MTLSDRMVVMNEGRVAQQGAPLEVYNKPANTFAAGFVGSPKLNLVPGVVTDGVFRSADGLVLAAGNAVARQADPVTLGFRPEDLVIDPADAAVVPARIEHLAPRAIVAVEAPGARIES
jgi:multiple sugar transport system ATP-binding protein